MDSTMTDLEEILQIKINDVGVSLKIVSTAWSDPSQRYHFNLGCLFSTVTSINFLQM